MRPATMSMPGTDGIGRTSPERPGEAPPDTSRYDERSGTVWHVRGTTEQPQPNFEPPQPCDQRFPGGRDRRRSGDLALFRCPPVSSQCQSVSLRSQNPWSRHCSIHPGTEWSAPDAGRSRDRRGSASTTHHWSAT